MTNVIVIATVIAIGAALAFFAAKEWPRYCSRRDALRLHRRLCQASDLSEAETQWLWEFASGASISDHALVFVQPSLLAGVAASDATRAESIRQKLFGD